MDFESLAIRYLRRKDAVVRTNRGARLPAALWTEQLCL